MSALLTAVLVVVALLVLPKLWRRARGPGRSDPFHVDVEGDLLAACHGDRAMAERLLQSELKRKPELSRTGAALMALSRLRDDQR